MEKLKWLGYPQSVLNKVKTDEELADVNYTQGSKREGDAPLEYNTDEGEEGVVDDWETESEAEDDDEKKEGEWEEQLVYVVLNDIPSVQELFAVQPDDFIQFHKKRYRQKSQPVKATHSKLALQFHQFESTSPILQIGNRYFSCQWEEPTGSALFFRKKTSDLESTSTIDNSQRPSSSSLQNIVPEPIIPFDTVFGAESLEAKDTYEAVALADKVLKTELMEAASKKLSRIPTNRQFFGRPGTYKFKVPQGYTATDLLAGEYKPKRIYLKPRQLKKRQQMPSKQQQQVESALKTLSVDSSSNADDKEKEGETPRIESPMEVDPETEVSESGEESAS